MRVTLINPPREHEIIGNNPSIIEEERGYNPPLGLLYVAAYLEQHSDHDVTVIDAQVEELSYTELTQRLRELAPEVVGITTMTLTLIDVLETARRVKEVRAATPVVLGGPHVHLFPEETIALENVDFLVLGEGEEAFTELLDALDDKDRLRQISGLVFQDGDGCVNTGIRPAITDLDRLPFPARHLVPYEKYSSLLARRNPVTTIFTSRGCPFQCTFCDRPNLGKTFRARSATDVVDELEACTRMGIHEFLFYDDTFTVHKRRAVEICKEIIRRRLDIGWDIRTRVDTVDEELIGQLRRAGCQGIHYGIEAGTERILQVLNKGISLELAASVFAMTRAQGIPILAYFMIGNPSETRAEIEATFQVMKRLDPDYVHLTILTPFPGTRIYLDGLRDGTIARDFWREFARHPTPGFRPPHWDEVHSRAELEEMLRSGYKGFYMRPKYIFKRLRALRSLGEFKRKAAAACKVLRMS